MREYTPEETKLALRFLMISMVLKLSKRDFAKDNDLNLAVLRRILVPKPQVPFFPRYKKIIEQFCDENMKELEV